MQTPFNAFVIKCGQRDESNSFDKQVFSYKKRETKKCSQEFERIYQETRLRLGLIERQEII